MLRRLWLAVCLALVIGCQAVVPMRPGAPGTGVTVQVALGPWVAKTGWRTQAAQANIQHITLNMVPEGVSTVSVAPVRLLPPFGVTDPATFAAVPDGTFRLTAEAFSSTDDLTSITQGGAVSSTNTATIANGAVTYSVGSSFTPGTLLLRGADAVVTIAGGIAGTLTATLLDASQAVVVPAFETTASTFRIRNLRDGVFTLWGSVRNGGVSTPDRPIGTVTVSNNANTIAGALNTPIGNTIRNAIGSGSGDGGAATDAQLVGALSVVYRAGMLYVAQYSLSRVRRIDLSTGRIDTVAGFGRGSTTPEDGSLATAAPVAGPTDMVFDSQGNLYISDNLAGRVRRVAAATGIITNVAGTGVASSGGDGGLATAAQLYNPWGLAIDASDNLYVAEQNGNRIRRIDKVTGLISTVAGTGRAGYNGDGIAATAAMLNHPGQIGFDPDGNLLIADKAGHRVRRLTMASGLISTVAGTGAGGYNGDGGMAAAAQLNTPYGVTTDSIGNIFIADSINHRIRRIDKVSGLISTVAGTGTAGFSGDSGAATGARLNFPIAVTVAGSGNLYICDRTNGRMRKVDAGTGVISTIAGAGNPLFSGDGGPALTSQLYWPTQAVVDATGNTYVTDYGNYRIRRTDKLTGIITTVVGTGTAGSAGDGGPATAAQVNLPYDLAFDTVGNLYIIDGRGSRIRKVSAATGLISTVGGTGVAGYSGDGGAATSAQISPSRLCVDAANRIVFLDSTHRIRRIDQSTGLINTLAGTGVSGYTITGGQASTAMLANPDGICAFANSVWFAEKDNHTIRRINLTTGVLETIAGNGSAGYAGDGGLATTGQLSSPSGMCRDGFGNLYVADYGNRRIRRVSALGGVITTVAGTGVLGDGSNNGTATSAALSTPWSVSVDRDGSLLVTEIYSNQIRKID